MRAANPCSTSRRSATPCGGGAASFRPTAFTNGAPASRKRPYFVRAKAGAPIAFAGLWETWTGPNGEEVDTAAIVTTRANRVARRHSRPHAGDRGAGGLRSLARLRRGRAETAAALIAPAPKRCSNATKSRRR